MSINFGELFRKVLRDERKVLRPHFFPTTQTEPAQLVMEESYLQLRLSRMFLKYHRELFQTKYPVVNSLMRFAGLDGQVEINYVARPELAGNDNESNLDDVVTLDQTILGPVLYRGGDLELMLGLYAAPADDWAQRFISLAEGVSQLALNATLTTAVSLAGTIKTSLENALASDKLDLKLGVDKELKKDVWLAPGYLVMIATPDDTINFDDLTIQDGELMNKSGRVYDDNDYFVLSIEVTTQRSDWQSLGYGRLWKDMLDTAADADDIERVKEAYATFSGAILASTDLSWSDRRAIVSLAQQRIKEIRDARAADDFFAGMKGIDELMKIEELKVAPEQLPKENIPNKTSADLLQTNWIG